MLDDLSELVQGLTDGGGTLWSALAAMLRQPGIWLLRLCGSTEDNSEGCLAPLVGMGFWSSLLIGYCAWIFYG